MEELPSNQRVELLQTHQVTEIKCHRLNVTVERGEDISKGRIRDFIDTPDPYVELLVKGIPQGNPKTKTIDNSINPVWNESFIFYLDPSKEYNLDVALFDENMGKDGLIGRQTIDLIHLKPNDNVEKVLKFGKKSKIHMKLLLKEDWEPDLRYSTDLCDQEKVFLTKRKENAFQAIKKILRSDDSPVSPNNVEEIPIIGVLASGGGYRALIGYAGALAALHKCGILDCVTYIAGLSGSSWCLAWLFSHPEYFTKGPSGLLKELKERMSVKSYKSAMRKITKEAKKVKEKMDEKLPVSLTDLFGHLVGDMLLRNRKDSNFSDVRDKLKDAKAPLPLCTCLSVKNDVSARNFGEWIEFSPYEVGWTKYGIFMDIKHFGSLFYMGNIVQQYPEQPLHFLLGCWGNAFSISIDRILPGGDADVFKKKEPSLDTTDSPREMIKALPIVEKDSLVFQGQNGTFMRFRKRKRASLQESEAIKRLHQPVSNMPNGISADVQVTNGKDNDLIEKDSAKYGNDGDLLDSHEKETDVNKYSSAEENEKDLDDEDEEDTEKEGYGFWVKMLIRTMKTFEIIQNRELRAGRVFNPLRGIPFKTTARVLRSTSIEDFQDKINDSVEKEAEQLILADAGLSFNLPYPLLQRPQRGIDIYLSFDFSTRPTDLHEPFKEIILAENWAKMNKIPFPPVKKLAQKYCREPMREIYVFNNPHEAGCPVIIHFILFNNTFRIFKSPGVKRKTQEEVDFANFDIFTDPAFSMFNFKYEGLNFERLSQLTEFNTLLGLDEIKEQMKIIIRKKQKMNKWGKIKNIIKHPFRKNNT